MKKIVIILLLLTELLGCGSAPGVRMEDAPTLPTHVPGASDPDMVKLQQTLSREGVRIITMGQMYLVSIPSSLLFPDESPRLLWGSYNILNDVVCYLRQFRKISVYVNGYSSPYISKRREHALTLARAKVVAEYLWSQNVETRFIFTRGLGSDKPIVALAKCTDASPNSRIEIVFRRAII